jgi:hypothetical protein
MSSNWIFPLEMCASGGVLDYDAAADLMDMPQRFVGHPKIADIPAISQPLLLPPNTKIKGELGADCYGDSELFEKNPTWKKWLFGGLVALGVLALVFRKRLPKLSGLKKPDFSKLGTSIKDFGKRVLEYVKKPFEWIGTKLKK